MSKLLNEMVQKWSKRKKGHFAVYTKEGKKFLVPLCYLNHPIFRVLLEMAEEEFGTATSGPLQVPCEEEFMEYIFTLLRKNIPSVQVESHHLVSSNGCEGILISSLRPS
ncbi:SAUR-like auxin-responsive protein family [Euphorbia peplus]|nr:SAUR-like auxin-responsive protein family [Euphorbia peplus]